MTAREAERAGARLERMTRRRHGWLVAALALGMIAAVGALASGWLAATILVGGGGLLIMWLFVTLQRANLIHDLALEPQAYVVPDVRRFGTGLVVEPGRSRIAASLDHVLANAGKPGSYYLADRVDACRDQIRALALAFGAPASRIEPTSAATCRWLLTDAANSPLYNWKLPPENLVSVLHRIRSGVRP